MLGCEILDDARKKWNIRWKIRQMSPCVKTNAAVLLSLKNTFE